MGGYKLATLQTSRGQRAAAVIGDRAYDVAELTGTESYTSVQAILDDWVAAHDAIEGAAVEPKGPFIEIAAAEFLAPLPIPRVLYCAGANYRDHAEEMAVLSGKPPEDPRPEGATPWFFLKSPHTVAPPFSDLAIAADGRNVDWEAELAVVVGSKLSNGTIEEAWSCIAGYTCANDLSARDRVFRANLPLGSPFRADWHSHKNFDGSCPMGPWIVPALYVSNPMDLTIKLWVNDAIKQDSNTRNMVFDIGEMLAALSASITLYPGDIVLTGTPAGVGIGRGEFLAAGDCMQLEIGEVGAIRNIIERCPAKTAVH